jgi:purine-nucleoside phosphorylase
MMEKIKEARDYLLSQCADFPKTVIVMGSGMSSVLSEMPVEKEIAFKDIPNVPSVSVEGHTGKIKIGKIGNQRIAISQGRLHFYEGLPMSTVVLPFRAMALAGADTFILTNAAGGIHPERKPMSLLLIRDHLCLMGTNPLIGPNLPELGPRFPDMTQIYDAELRAIFSRAAKTVGIDLPEGIYVAIHGPSYETPAEIRMYRMLGGDVVGMSTAPEAIALRHMGKRVVGISCITNLAAGIGGEVLTHSEVLENAKHAHSRLGMLLKEAIGLMGAARG